MNKHTTQALKGIAILLMLFLHLFNQEHYVALTTPFITLMDKPLASWFVPFTHICVPIYLFLSGYGLYISSKKQSKTPFKRIMALYEKLWMVLLLFVGLGTIIAPQLYPGDMRQLLSNLTGWNTTYNGEWWFFFPYIVLVALSPWLIQWVKRFNWKYWLVGLPLLHFITFAAMRFYGDWVYSNQAIYYAVSIPHYATIFLAGALFAKEHLFERFQTVVARYKCNNNWLLAGGILALIVARSILPFMVLKPYFAIAFMLLFSALQRGEVLNRVLCYFGSHSTNMWLTHSFFCYYLFSDFVYGFKYPVVIFGVLVLLSLASSYVVNLVSRIWSAIKMNILEASNAN